MNKMILSSSIFKQYALKVVFGLLVICTVVSCINIAVTKHKQALTSSYSLEGVSLQDRERQIKCLARNIYHEAGGEPFEGKVAVAQVTINRAESGKFPSDVCAVIYQKSNIVGSIVCQFSWYCMNPSQMALINPARYQESEAVAKKVLLEGFRLDGLKGALYYHADYVNPGWNLRKITKIGRHIFYGNRDANI